MKNREFTAQYLSPPIILSLSMQEAQVLNENMDRFTRIGFEIEPFGGEEYAVRAIPDNLFGIAKKRAAVGNAGRSGRWDQHLHDTGAY